MENKNLMVLFPGRGYTIACPLLYYADFKYDLKGYEIVKISYGNFNNIDDIKSFVLTQVKELDFSIYNDVVFLSKSMGTVLAGWLAETLSNNIRHIYLTPIKNTLQYIKSKKIYK